GSRAGNFTVWAKNQPNNVGDEDCAHTLGIGHNYKWNDVKCSDCYQYTCKKDLNECSGSKICHPKAYCTNLWGSFKCTCTGNGFNCINGRGLQDSAIVGSNINHLTLLFNWLKPVAKSVNPFWKHCWRASVDGWAARTFHSRCDGMGPTVTIIRVGRYIFGGYTSESWANYRYRYRYDSKAFLFSLVNKPGWAPVKLPQTGKYASSFRSIGSENYYGPMFGAGNDIFISSYASSNSLSYSDLGHTYSPPSGYSYRSRFARTFLAGTYRFTPDEVEVFYETTKMQ
ncbi:unnamed protein product, partial [Porites lobata]